MVILLDCSRTRWFSWQSTKSACKTWTKRSVDILHGNRLSRSQSGALELTPHQIKQAKEQKETADGIVVARLPEAYQWLLVATQASPQSVLDWKAFRLSGQDPSRLERARNCGMMNCW